MTLFGLKNSTVAPPRWTALFLAACFSFMTLLGTPLHAHDLDPLHLDPDCVPCHLSHSGVGLEIDTPDLNIAFQATLWVASPVSLWISNTPLTTSSRAPPAFR